MTPAALTAHGAAYLALLEERKILVSPAIRGLLHGLIEYLVNMEAVEELPLAGTPSHSER